MKINIPESDNERVVVLGGGFAGLALARKLMRKRFQVVLIDKNNYHQFQPLFYQVAMAGLEPSSISFPFRKLFRNASNMFFRVTEVTAVDVVAKKVITPLGHCNYDHLVIAIGADTNYYNNQQIAEAVLPMKSVGEALFLRNTILQDFENALTLPDHDERQPLLDIVIVGGGPTGVELAGALAEMKQYILPKDYPELDTKEIDIHLVQSAPQLLKGMSDVSAQKALAYLKDLGVSVHLNAKVTNYDGEKVCLSNGEELLSRKVIWAAGITGNKLPGLPEEAITHGNRIKVDAFNAVMGVSNVYAIGDIAYMEEEAFPQGHPQVAQVAIQQGRRLAANLLAKQAGKSPQPFHYQDKGSMATVGRNRALVDLPKFSFQGFWAWAVWLLVHLFAILGTKNKLFIFVNWLWNYVTYDQSLRLILRAKPGGFRK